VHLGQKSVHVLVNLLALTFKFLLDQFHDLVLAARARNRLPDRTGNLVQAVNGSEIAHAFTHGHDQSLTSDSSGNNRI